MKHFVRVGVLVTIGTVLMILLLGNVRLAPPQASTQSTIVDRLMSLQIYVIAFLFALIMVFVIYSVVVFRRRSGDDGDGAYIPGNAKLELIWTILPLLTVIFFATLGSIDLTRMTKVEANELVVDVVGAQFSWTFGYPDYDIESSELVLPVNQAVLFKISSKDVIHSFWVPEFRIKQDAVPDRLTTLRITTSEMGDYKVRCAEMCGYAHSYMLAPVRVVSPADFQAWITQQQGGAVATPGAGGPAERGQSLANSQGCLACHSIDGSVKAAPTWKGLFGLERPLADGTTVVADEAYLHESIVDPSAKIVKGFSDIMLQTYASMPDEDVNALVEYIKTLK